VHNNFCQTCDETGEYIFQGGKFLMMWVITVYLKENLSMFEFNSEKEAKEAFKRIHGCKILTEVINYHNPSYALVAV